jgi:hypothetical protein
MTSALNIAASTGRWLHREMTTARPVFIFFAIGFLVELMLIKLALAQFSVPLAALSKALVGALFAAKAVVILDETSLARRLESYRRIFAIAVKTLLYGGCAMLLVFIERYLEATHHVGLDGAWSVVTAQATIYRMMAWVLGISVVFAIYFACFEINRTMGEGALRSLFFEAPRDSEPFANRLRLP